MKLSIFVTAALVCAAGVFADAARKPEHKAQSHGDIVCQNHEERTLKWYKFGKDGMPERKKGQFLAFSSTKDGRRYATTLEKDGSPAKPVKFRFQRCGPKDGSAGYMGWPKGRQGDESAGHLQLVEDPKQCLTLEKSPKAGEKGLHLVLDQCRYGNSKQQLAQTFGLPVNGITTFLRRPLKNKVDFAYQYRVDSKEKGKPFVVDVVNEHDWSEKGTTHSLQWLSWPQ